MREEDKLQMDDEPGKYRFDDIPDSDFLMVMGPGAVIEDGTDVCSLSSNIIFSKGRERGRPRLYDPPQDTQHDFSVLSKLDLTIRGSAGRSQTRYGRLVHRRGNQSGREERKQIERQMCLML
jgi:hypothetical protein